MSATLSIRCPVCNARIKAPMQLIGKTRSCPRCRHRLEVQPQLPDEEQPMLVEDDEWAAPRPPVSGLFSRPRT
jgi:uncharacterized paraquat-inducible protein A